MTKTRSSNLLSHKTTTKLISNPNISKNSGENLQIPCQDFNKNFCSFFARKGYCEKKFFANGLPVTVSCSISCKSCSKFKIEQTTIISTIITTSTSTTSIKTTTQITYNKTECADSNTILCQYFAKQNFCSDKYFMNGVAMTKSCKMSCNLC